jgi:DNA repair exonuclease SbcCD ATPase subunit
MKIVNIQVAGFRAFGRKQSFDLDADVVIVNGSNGQGKTSLFDSILWGLSGIVPRIAADDHALLSKFSDTGQIEVTVKLRNEAAAEILVRRSFDGEQQRLRFEYAGQIYRDADAEGKLQNVLWPGAKTSTDPRRAVADTITRSVYLQQDVLREFLTRDDEQARFSSIADLIGVGQLSDLRLQLDRARTAWSTITNQRIAELAQRESKLGSLREELSRTELKNLEGAPIPVWNTWWSRASKFLPTLQIPEPDQSGAAAVLDRTIRIIQSQSNNLLRQRDLISTLRVDVDRHTTKATQTDIEQLRTRVSEAKQEIQLLRQRLSKEVTNIAAFRRSRAESKSLQDKLALFASLALQLLGDQCPVCSQKYDVESTRARLERLSQTAPEITHVEEEPSVKDLEDQLKKAEQESVEIEAELREAELARQQHERWFTTVSDQLRQLGIEIGDDLAQALTSSASKVEPVISEMQELIKDGERLSIQLLQISDRSRAKELQSQITVLERENAGLKADLEGRQAAGNLATKILEALRESEDDVVQLQLEEINPLLQRIYSRIDPNPVFRSVSLVSKFLKGRGHLNPKVADPSLNVSSTSPEQILSSSQVNALALSLFVSLNFGLPKLPIDALLLDDPLQSLDEINLLGVADLLRRAKPVRQLIVSTHDERFIGLLQRKLRPIQDNERLLMINLSGWSRSGPEVEINSAQPDLQPMRIAV